MLDGLREATLRQGHCARRGVPARLRPPATLAHHRAVLAQQRGRALRSVGRGVEHDQRDVGPIVGGDRLQGKAFLGVPDDLTGLVRPPGEPQLQGPEGRRGLQVLGRQAAFRLRPHGVAVMGTRLAELALERGQLGEAEARERLVARTATHELPELPEEPLGGGVVPSGVGHVGPRF